MNELIDKQILKLFEGLWDNLTKVMDMFVGTAQILAALCMLLYFGVESFRMISGDKKWEIIPLLRPFAIALVIIFWGSFVDLINTPANALTDISRDVFYEQLDEIEELSRHRYALIDSVAVSLSERSLEVERAENAKENDKAWYEIDIDFDIIGNKLAGMWLIVTSKIKFVMVQLMERVVIVFFQFCTYIVFFLQIIFGAILITLGPISFALSILPVFREAYVQWISRFISVQLYSCIAYIVLSVSCVVLKYGLETEIGILEEVMDDEAAFLMYVTQTSGDVSIYIVCALIAGVSMLTIPIVSTWIIQTSGVGQAIGAVTGATAGAGKAVVGAVI